MVDLDNFDFDIEPSELHVVDAASAIVSAYISNNKIERDELVPLIREIFSTLRSLERSSGAFATRQEPAVAIEDSITDDYIVCLEDGKRLKMLKRHLKSSYNMTPEQYRERWGLPADYPMVAPNYAVRRSQLAKEIGLGTSRRKGDLRTAA